MSRPDRIGRWQPRVWRLGGLAVPGLRENTLIAEDSCPVCRLTEPQTVRLEHLYDVLYDELTEATTTVRIIFCLRS